MFEPHNRNFISDKKNITQNYNCLAKYILHNTWYIITNINVSKKPRKGAITNIVFERT